jgi:hypothetical protein
VRLIAFPVPGRSRRASPHVDRAAGFSATRCSANWRGNMEMRVVGPIMPQMETPSNPTGPHGRVTRALAERDVRVAGAPRDRRRPCGGARTARCGSSPRPTARCLPFTVASLVWAPLAKHGLDSFWQIYRLKLVFPHSPVRRHASRPVPRSSHPRRSEKEINRPRHLGRPAVRNRRFSIDTPEEPVNPDAAATSTRTSVSARRSTPSSPRSAREPLLAESASLVSRLSDLSLYAS